MLSVTQVQQYNDLLMSENLCPATHARDGWKSSTFTMQFADDTITIENIQTGLESKRLFTSHQKLKWNEDSQGPEIKIKNSEYPQTTELPGTG